jgi:hypothetical protein
VNLAIWQFLNHVVKATVFTTQCALGQLFYLEDLWILRQHIVSVHRNPFIEETQDTVNRYASSCFRQPRFNSSAMQAGLAKGSAVQRNVVG